MLFDNNNVDLDFSFLNLANVKNMDKTNDMMQYYKMDDAKFLNAKDGFLRGNMFRNEYVPYKNLTYIPIKPKSDREAKLFNVMQYSFAINDLNLYLDLHPDDKNALRFLEELIKEEKEAKKEYMASYGPLTVSNTKGDKFEWIDDPWSWQNLGGNIYV